jgi:hypothetical protein
VLINEGVSRKEPGYAFFEFISRNGNGNTQIPTLNKDLTKQKIIDAVGEVFETKGKKG